MQGWGRTQQTSLEQGAILPGSRQSQAREGEGRAAFETRAWVFALEHKPSHPLQCRASYQGQGVIPQAPLPHTLNTAKMSAIKSELKITPLVCKSEEHKTV